LFYVDCCRREGEKKKAWIEVNWKARKLLENLDGINDILIILVDWEKLKKVEGKLSDN
jgi:hypothetical protein